MKNCPYCNNVLADNAHFCAVCSRQVIGDHSQDENNDAVNDISSEDKNKKTNKSSMVVAFIILFAVIAAIVVFLIVTDKEDEPDTTTDQIVETDSDTYTDNSTTENVTDDAENTSGTDENSTSEENTSEEEQSSTVTGVAKTDFDILTSGNFYIKGSMVDANGLDSPMEIAVTANSIFMLSEFSGASMGMLIKDDTMYMIYEEKKVYLEMTKGLMNMVGIDMNDFNFSSDTDFSSFGTLADADLVTTENYAGKECTVYHYVSSDASEKRFYMDGDSLLRIANYSADGKFVSATDIELITGNVPVSKSSPPEGYKAYSGFTGIVPFMGLLEDVM